MRQYPNNLRIKKILETLPTNNDGESLEKEFNSLTSAFNSNKYDLVIENGISLLKKNENDKIEIDEQIERRRRRIRKRHFCDASPVRKKNPQLKFGLTKDIKTQD